MAPDTADLSRDGLALDADQRALVADVLFESPGSEDAQSEVDAAWQTEATRRLVEAQSGAVDHIDADDHYAELRASLTASLSRDQDAASRAM